MQPVEGCCNQSWNTLFISEYFSESDIDKEEAAQRQKKEAEENKMMMIRELERGMYEEWMKERTM